MKISKLLSKIKKIFKTEETRCSLDGGELRLQNFLIEGEYFSPMRDIWECQKCGRRYI